jgi:hypothetical protein
MAAGVWFLQESPRWLIEKDRHEDARLVLEKLHGNGSNAEFLDLEYREIRDTIVAEATLSVKTWSGLISRPSWRRRLALGCGVQAFGQLSGVNVSSFLVMEHLTLVLIKIQVINYYGNVIYKLLGIETETSLMIIGISGALSIVYCAAGLFLLDKFGRIKPLIFSAVGCGLSLCVNAVLSQYYVVSAGTETATSPSLVLSHGFTPRKFSQFRSEPKQTRFQH